MNNTDKAVQLFKDGYNCSQSVLGAFAESLGLEPQAALKLASGFGGGLGGGGDVCGALTGAIMVLGLKYGSAQAGDKTAKAQIYRKTRLLTEEYKLQTGSLHCRDLLGFDLGTEVGRQAARQPGAFDDCPQFVRIAAEILEEILSAEN